jgi:hypothetical protein
LAARFVADGKATVICVSGRGRDDPAFHGQGAVGRISRSEMQSMLHAALVKNLRKIFEGSLRRGYANIKTATVLTEPERRMP